MVYLPTFSQKNPTLHVLPVNIPQRPIPGSVGSHLPVSGEFQDSLDRRVSDVLAAMVFIESRILGAASLSTIGFLY